MKPPSKSSSLPNPIKHSGGSLPPNAEGVKELVEHRKRLKRWWLTDSAGDTLFVMRYGSRPLEIDKGKTAINMGKKENLIPVIDALITAVRNGELDEAVKALDRPRFKKKAA